MAINTGELKITLVNKQPNSIKNIIEKVRGLNKLGNVLDKEVISLQKELSKWRV